MPDFKNLLGDNKTYVVAAAMALLGWAVSHGYITISQYNDYLPYLVAAGAVTLRWALQKIQNILKDVQAATAPPAAEVIPEATLEQKVTDLADKLTALADLVAGKAEKK